MPLDHATHASRFKFYFLSSKSWPRRWGYQARRETELPEQLLGACALARVDMDDLRLPYLSKRRQTA